MTKILRSLENISTGYSIFEKDQVLTHSQLNSVADYCNDETRLTRVKLLGVGIVCGLRVTRAGSSIVVSKGVGVTTDGDLLFLEADTVFDKFKVYDKSAPEYAPFFKKEEMIEAYELGVKGEKDERATPLSKFTTDRETTLNNLVAVLVMESYVQDDDLCSGTDCDNLGQNSINRIKLLLVDKGAVGQLQPFIATPNQTASILNEIVADRPLISAGVNSLPALGQVYRTACNSIHAKLLAELPKVYAKGSSFLSDTFPADPAPGWIGRLEDIKGSFANTHVGIQYYYDFLKDLVETWNHFRGLLFGEKTWCCPDIDAFPKHLLLGNVVAGTDPNENRTPFYPSPIVSRTMDELCHAKFLAKKINTLIATFQVPVTTAAAPVRLTPSCFEEDVLEERAIPFYYRVNTTEPIHKNWSYQLSQRGMEASNYSYNAAAYGAQGAAANPLMAQLGRFSFFRIEGHLGQNVSTVTAVIEREINSKNLPIVVRTVLLGADRTKVVRKPGNRYSDLHRFHYVLRQDLFHQLDDVVQFSQSFKQQVDTAVSANVVTNSAEDNDGAPVRDIAAEKNATISSKAESARARLSQNYSQYKADVAWKSDFSDTTKAAGEFKYNLGKVVKTEFNTPFDSLISSTHARWVDWLDVIIKSKEDKEDDRLLLANFLSEHPGIEHFAGVLRGGTFVLVHDENNTVVADFMLPYRCCETTEDEPEEPALPKPGVKPNWIVDNGIKVQPSYEKLVKGKLENFRIEQDQIWNTKFDFQKNNFSLFKDSISLMGSVFGNLEKTKAGLTNQAFGDKYLGLQMTEADTKKQRLELLKQKSKETTLPEETRKYFETQIGEAEVDLAKTINQTADYISRSGADVSTGSDGYNALVSLSGSVGTLTNTVAVNSVKEGLTGIQNTTGNANLKVIIGSLMLRR